MEKDILHIALSTDHNYVPYVAILLVSIFDTNKTFSCINIHLLSYNLSNEDVSIIKKHIPNNGNLQIYDVSNIRQRLTVTVPNTISIAAYSRLFLSSLLPEDITKVIYMDSDSILCGSLEKLWSLDLSNIFVAGVLDDVSDFAKKIIGLTDNDTYINSGFLLINLSQWRKEQVEKKIVQELVKNNGQIYHHDQGLLNIVCRGKILVLPINYNMVTNFFTFSYKTFQKKKPFYSEKEFNNGIKHPIFLHFTAGVANRPWMKNCRHPLQNIFLKYKEKSLFSTIGLQKDNRKISLKMLAFFFYHVPFLYYFVLRLRSLILREY